MYEWDAVKRHSNLSKHGVDFHSMQEFDWGQALVEPDDGHNEQRWIATGFIGLRLYVAAFTELDKGRVRVISLRKASGREEKSYVKHLKRR